MIGHIQHFSSK